MSSSSSSESVSLSLFSRSIIVSGGDVTWGVMAVAISLFISALIQGMQQHPHKVSMAANTATDTRIDDTKLRYFPNMSIQLSHVEVSTPECSFIFLFRVFRPSRALVKRPSAAVFFGMKVQHRSPNIEQTPFFSLSSMSSAILFWKDISDVALSCSATAWRPDCVRFPRHCTL